MIYEGTVTKAEEHTLEDGSTLTWFTLEYVPGHAFLGASDWLPLLDEAIELRTHVRVKASMPEPVKCTDPMCEDEDCANVPEGERVVPFILRADTVEWL